MFVLVDRMRQINGKISQLKLNSCRCRNRILEWVGKYVRIYHSRPEWPGRCESRRDDTQSPRTTMQHKCLWMCTVCPFVRSIILKCCKMCQFIIVRHGVQGKII